MAHPLVFICPVCHAEDSIEKSSCSNCHQEFQISPDGISFSKRNWTLPDLTEWMSDIISVNQHADVLQTRRSQIAHAKLPAVLRISGKATLRQGKRSVPFRSFANIFQRVVICPVPVTEGWLAVCNSAFFFVSSQKIWHFELKDLTCITTNGHYFEFRIKGEPFWQIEFHHESPLKYEILFRKLIIDFYAGTGSTCVEFQPKIRFAYPASAGKRLKLKPLKAVNANVYQKIATAVLRWILRILLRLFIRVNIRNKNLMPHDYPFITIVNHQSIFDPFILLAFLDGRIGFLTKSTSFCSFIERKFLRLGKAIPTTRFQTDPEVIYHIRTFLESGIPVGIFPEGERCWDGRLQSFKISVIRLLTQFEVPVVPVIISRSFQFFPRWAKRPSTAEISLEVIGPFCILPDIYSYEEIQQWLQQLFLRVLKN